MVRESVGSVRQAAPGHLTKICCFMFLLYIIKAAKRIFNSDKICRSYSDLNFGVTFFGTQCTWLRFWPTLYSRPASWASLPMSCLFYCFECGVNMYVKVEVVSLLLFHVSFVQHWYLERLVRLWFVEFYWIRRRYCYWFDSLQKKQSRDTNYITEINTFMRKLTNNSIVAEIPRCRVGPLRGNARHSS